MERTSPLGSRIQAGGEEGAALKVGETARAKVERKEKEVHAWTTRPVSPDWGSEMSGLRS